MCQIRVWNIDYQHITEYANRIFGCPLDMYHNLKICSTMYQLVSSGRPKYLLDELWFGRCTRMLNILSSFLRCLVGASSFFAKDAILWNGLTSGVSGMSVCHISVILILSVMCKLFVLYFFFFFRSCQWDSIVQFSVYVNVLNLSTKWWLTSSILATRRSFMFFKIWHYDTIAFSSKR
jgi:hypothetical protein